MPRVPKKLAAYNHFKQRLAKARDPVWSGKPLPGRAFSTRLFIRDDVITVRFHQTDIVTLYPNGKVEITNGGWKTVGTKKRINAYSPVNVQQKNGCWYIHYAGKVYEFEREFYVNGDRHVYKNGRKLKPLKAAA